MQQIRIPRKHLTIFTTKLTMSNSTKQENNIGTIFEPVSEPEIEIMLSRESTVIEEIVHLGTRITMGLTHSIINEKPRRVLSENDRVLARKEIVKAIREGSLEGPFELAMDNLGNPCFFLRIR